MSDADLANVIALLRFEGADASTVIRDDAPIGSPTRAWTANGNAQIDTAQYVFGGGSSLLLDGTGDYVSTPDHIHFTVSQIEFCVEAWVRYSSLSGFQIICGQGNSALANSSISFNIQKTDAHLFRFNAKTGSGEAVDISGTTTVLTNYWYHVAVSAQSIGSPQQRTYRLFVDGDIEASATTDAMINDSGNAFAIGRCGEHNAFYHNGWIGGFRFTRNTPRYTAAFSRPTSMFPIA